VLVSGDSKTVLSDEGAQQAYFGKRNYHDTGMISSLESHGAVTKPADGSETHAA
jgi:hypothetical protein